MSELNEAQKVAWAGFVAGDWARKRQRAWILFKRTTPRMKVMILS